MMGEGEVAWERKTDHAMVATSADETPFLSNSDQSLDWFPRRSERLIYQCIESITDLINRQIDRLPHQLGYLSNSSSRESLGLSRSSYSLPEKVKSTMKILSEDAWAIFHSLTSLIKQRALASNNASSIKTNAEAVEAGDLRQQLERLVTRVNEFERASRESLLNNDVNLLTPQISDLVTRLRSRSQSDMSVPSSNKLNRKLAGFYEAAKSMGMFEGQRDALHNMAIVLSELDCLVKSLDEVEISERDPDERRFDYEEDFSGQDLSPKPSGGRHLLENVNSFSEDRLSWGENGPRDSGSNESRESLDRISSHNCNELENWKSQTPKGIKESGLGKSLSKGIETGADPNYSLTFKDSGRGTLSSIDTEQVIHSRETQNSYKLHDESLAEKHRKTDDAYYIVTDQLDLDCSKGKFANDEGIYFGKSDSGKRESSKMERSHSDQVTNEDLRMGWDQPSFPKIETISSLECCSLGKGPEDRLRSGSFSGKFSRRESAASNSAAVSRDKTCRNKTGIRPMSKTSCDMPDTYNLFDPDNNILLWKESSGLLSPVTASDRTTHVTGKEHHSYSSTPHASRSPRERNVDIRGEENKQNFSVQDYIGATSSDRRVIQKQSRDSPFDSPVTTPSSSGERREISRSKAYMDSDVHDTQFSHSLAGSNEEPGYLRPGSSDGRPSNISLKLAGSFWTRQSTDISEDEGSSRSSITGLYDNAVQHLNELVTKSRLSAAESGDYPQKGNNSSSDAEDKGKRTALAEYSHTSDIPMSKKKSTTSQSSCGSKCRRNITNVETLEPEFVAASEYISARTSSHDHLSKGSASSWEKIDYPSEQKLISVVQQSMCPNDQVLARLQSNGDNICPGAHQSIENARNSGVLETRPRNEGKYVLDKVYSLTNDSSVRMNQAGSEIQYCPSDNVVIQQGSSVSPKHQKQELCRESLHDPRPKNSVSSRENLDYPSKDILISATHPSHQALANLQSKDDNISLGACQSREDNQRSGFSRTTDSAEGLYVSAKAYSPRNDSAVEVREVISERQYYPSDNAIMKQVGSVGLKHKMHKVRSDSSSIDTLSKHSAISCEKLDFPVKDTLMSIAHQCHYSSDQALAGLQSNDDNIYVGASESREDARHFDLSEGSTLRGERQYISDKANIPGNESAFRANEVASERQCHSSDNSIIKDGSSDSREHQVHGNDRHFYLSRSRVSQKDELSDQEHKTVRTDTQSVGIRSNTSSWEALSYPSTGEVSQKSSLASHRTSHSGRALSGAESNKNVIFSNVLSPKDSIADEASSFSGPEMDCKNNIDQSNLNREYSNPRIENSCSGLQSNVSSWEKLSYPSNTKQASVSSNTSCRSNHSVPVAPKHNCGIPILYASDSNSTRGKLLLSSNTDNQNTHDVSQYNLDGIPSNDTSLQSNISEFGYSPRRQAVGGLRQSDTSLEELRYSSARSSSKLNERISKTSQDSRASKKYGTRASNQNLSEGEDISPSGDNNCLSSNDNLTKQLYSSGGLSKGMASVTNQKSADSVNCRGTLDTDNNKPQGHRLEYSTSSSEEENLGIKANNTSSSRISDRSCRSIETSPTQTENHRQEEGPGPVQNVSRRKLQETWSVSTKQDPSMHNQEIFPNRSSSVKSEPSKDSSKELQESQSVPIRNQPTIDPDDKVTVLQHTPGSQNYSREYLVQMLDQALENSSEQIGQGSSNGSLFLGNRRSHSDFENTESYFNVSSCSNDSSLTKTDSDYTQSTSVNNNRHLKPDAVKGSTSVDRRKSQENYRRFISSSSSGMSETEHTEWYTGAGKQWDKTESESQTDESPGVIKKLSLSLPRVRLPCYLNPKCKCIESISWGMFPTISRSCPSLNSAPKRRLAKWSFCSTLSESEQFSDSKWRTLFSYVCYLCFFFILCIILGSAFTTKHSTFVDCVTILFEDLSKHLELRHINGACV